MATIAQSYRLVGPKEFFFPFSVRVAGHIQVQVEGLGTVSPNDYTVEGASPASRGVTVRWPNAPADGSTLTILRVVPVERVTDFKDDRPIRADDLNAEFNNIYQILEQMS